MSMPISVSFVGQNLDKESWFTILSCTLSVSQSSKSVSTLHETNWGRGISCFAAPGWRVEQHRLQLRDCIEYKTFCQRSIRHQMQSDCWCILEVQEHVHIGNEIEKELLKAAESGGANAVFKVANIHLCCCRTEKKSTHYNWILQSWLEAANH